MTGARRCRGLAVNKPADPRDQLGRGPGRDGRRRRGSVGEHRVDPRQQLVDGQHGEDAGPVAELGDGRELVVGGMLAKIVAARHHQQRFACLNRADDRTHAGVCDEQPRALDTGAVAVRRHHPDMVGVAGDVGTAADLDQHRHMAVACGPAVDRLDEAVEGEHRADTGKQLGRRAAHSTAPQYSGVGAAASSGHWTTQAWASRRARAPDDDIRSLLAMLSIHRVRAPNRRPKPIASSAGADPVVTMTCGRTRATMPSSCAATTAKLAGFLRCASRNVKNAAPATSPADAACTVA